MSVSAPTPKSVTIDGQNFYLLAFYYPGSNTPWDDIYNAPFLGNFWISSVTITPPNQPSGTFHTAEAAFQATKWWQNDDIRKEFEVAKDGNAAFSVRNKKGKDGKTRPWTNSNYAGYGNNVKAMEAVLESKFQNQELAELLTLTGDSYLLEHNSHDDRDDFWSDNCDGSGQNQLGLALMRLRSQLGGVALASYPHPGEFTKHVLGCTECLRSLR